MLDLLDVKELFVLLSVIGPRDKKGLLIVRDVVSGKGAEYR